MKFRGLLPASEERAGENLAAPVQAVYAVNLPGAPINKPNNVRAKQTKQINDQSINLRQSQPYGTPRMVILKASSSWSLTV